MALAQRVKNANEIIKRLGKCAVEPKYDGFRIQIHKKGSKVQIFSRNLENMTKMFPELVSGCKNIKAREAVFEGEAIAYDEVSDQFLPFQVTVKRKRKYEIEKMAKDYPLVCFVFDLLYLNGKDMTAKSYSERRKALSRIVKKGVYRVTDSVIVNKSKEVEKWFNYYVSAGLEGLMAKDLKAGYSAGARKYSWIKLKRSYSSKLGDTVDLCIVGYLRGRGKRAKLGIGSLLGAVYNKKKDEFETLAKIGSGLTEKGTIDLRKRLNKFKMSKRPARVNSKLKMDVWVKPEIVVEVLADEITKSPAHTCAESKGEGLSLRFPRVVKLRLDKGPEDATSTKEIISMFKRQRKLK
jgi:DNA ligase-1